MLKLRKCAGKGCEQMAYNERSKYCIDCKCRRFQEGNDKQKKKRALELKFEMHPERTKCIFCKNDVKLSEFGGFIEGGLFCNNPICLKKVTRVMYQQDLSGEIEKILR